VLIDEERMENVRMLRESAAAVCDRSDLSRVRDLRFIEPGFDRVVWQTMAEMGWLGLRVPEEAGGSGLGMVEFCALAEELGGALVPEPLIAAVLATGVLHGEVLDAVVRGDKIILPAWQEHALGSGRLEAACETTLSREGLTGRKSFVSFPRSADGFVVDTTSGPALVSAEAEGVSIEELVLQDGGRWGTVLFHKAQAVQVGSSLEQAIDEATLANAAYLLGVIEAALDLTVEYLTTRTQFGVLIGSFQILQHMAVDMKLQAALTRAAVEEAARVLDGGADRKARIRAVSRAKARAAEAGIFVTRQAIQLHGGIGFSDDHDIGLYLRKAMVLAPAFGNSAYHRRRYYAAAYGDAKREA